MRKRTMYIFGRFILFGMIWSALGIAGPPQIWFAPLDDVSRQVNIFKGIIPSSDSGPTDYMDLFAPDAPWPAAASHVSVFKLYAGPITGITVPGFSGGFSDSQLQQIFSFLKQHNIAVALEFGPLTAADGCGTQMTDGQLNGVEGFAGTAVQAIVDKVQANGGTLDYLSMDEPFFYGNIYSGAGACNWSAQQIAQMP